MDDHQAFTITLQSVPGFRGLPIKRLALLLKQLLRQGGFRCVRLQPVTDDNEQGAGIEGGRDEST